MNYENKIKIGIGYFIQNLKAIRDKSIHFGAEVINRIYWFPNPSPSKLIAKDCALGELFDFKALSRKECALEVTKAGIISKKFIT